MGTFVSYDAVQTTKRRENIKRISTTIELKVIICVLQMIQKTLRE
jgi:hypothetical protein